MTREQYNFTFAYQTEAGAVTTVDVKAATKGAAVTKARAAHPDACATTNWMCLQEGEGDARAMLTEWLSTPRMDNKERLSAADKARLRDVLMTTAAAQGLSIMQLRELFYALDRMNIVSAYYMD